MSQKGIVYRMGRGRSADLVSPPNKLAARIFGVVGCLRLRAESTSWSDRDTGVDPTYPLALQVTLTLTRTPSRTPTRTQNGPEMGEERGCAAFVNLFTIPICGPLHSPRPM